MVAKREGKRTPSKGLTTAAKVSLLTSHSKSSSTKTVTRTSSVSAAQVTTGSCVSRFPRNVRIAYQLSVASTTSQVEKVNEACQIHSTGLLLVYHVRPMYNAL